MVERDEPGEEQQVERLPASRWVWLRGALLVLLLVAVALVWRWTPEVVLVARAPWGRIEVRSLCCQEFR
ncbi:MAG: hypothetical protein FJ125_05730 [Deltaproteobacteria bacterium]|nr:hypothetical protein [Deltaproteobacteria bacterium]